MAHVLENGCTVFNISDALENTPEDVREYITENVERLEAELEWAREEIKEAEEEAEKNLDYLHGFMCDVREEAEAVLEYIDTARRIDKKQLRHMIEIIWEVCNNEL